MPGITRKRIAEESLPLIRPCGATFPQGGRLYGLQLMNFFQQLPYNVALQHTDLFTADEEQDLVLAAGNADVCIGRLARAVDNTAHDGDLERLFEALVPQTALDLVGDLDHRVLGAPAGRAADNLGAAETKVVVTKGLTSVPEALQNTAFTTTEKIEKELVKQLSDEISGCKVSIYDVKLMLDFGDGSLIEAEENSFPAGGMDVWFDLPDGVTAENFSQFDIEVAHMLCTRDHAGEVELLKDPELDAANGKLKVHVGSFSPFAIGWKAKPASGPVVTPGTGSTGTTPGGSTGSNTGSNTNAGNSSNTAAGNAGGTAAAASGTAKPAGAADNKDAVPAKSGLIPQTSDSFPLLPVAGIALVSLAAVGLLALLKKKKHETR